jgi:hypothetical protein
VLFVLAAAVAFRGALTLAAPVDDVMLFGGTAR